MKNSICSIDSAEIALDQFRIALLNRGIAPKQVIADGELHRCPVEGARAGRKDGTYLLHLDGIPAGGFENFRDGLGWQNWHADIGNRKLDRSELALHRQRIETASRARAVDEEKRQVAAAKRAAHLWSIAKPATNNHSYLVRKAVPAYGLRQLREHLVIPARDSNGRIWTLEFIGANGEKRFLSGGRKKACYFSIGRVGDILCIAEGYATAASVYQATGYATAVAFDAGNLAPVACALRNKFPSLRLVICADDDRDTPGNPGRSNALAAARAANAIVATPQFGAAI